MRTPPDSPPPPTPLPPLCQTTPRWQELAPQLQTNLLIQLTTLLLQHVGHAAPRGTEVDDDNR
jgi:hypothetical protein